MVKVVRGQVQKSPDSLRPQVLHCLVTKCLTQFVIDTCGVAGKAYYDDQKRIEKPELVDLLKKD